MISSVDDACGLAILCLARAFLSLIKPLGEEVIDLIKPILHILVLVVSRP